MASGNKSLGRFDLTDIPPAPRGQPQIEVSLDIDANGILKVSAKDKATGKEQSIEIKSSSGLSDDEIEAMVKDAEAHAADDKIQRELIDARNSADGMVHATEKSIKEFGDKADAAEVAKIQGLIDEVKAAIKGDSKELIDTKSQELMEASGALAQAQAGGPAGEAPEGAAASDKKQDDDVVDAEFEEVDDTKK